jgi:hypothetical protein
MFRLTFERSSITYGFINPNFVWYLKKVRSSPLLSRKNEVFKGEKHLKIEFTDLLEGFLALLGEIFMLIWPDKKEKNRNK